MKKLLTPKNYTLAGLIIIATLSRLIPHAPNVTPITAIALFAGSMFDQKRLGIIVALSSLVLSDAIIGFHSLSLLVYSLFALIVLFGHYSLHQNNSILRTASVTIGSSLFFFLTTNFAVWISGNFYAHTLEGLITCYVAALPFLRNSMVGDVVFTGLIFGNYYALARKFPQLQH